MFDLLRFIAVLTLLSASGAATAAQSNWAASPEGRSRLVSGVTATGVDGAAPLGIEIVLKPGWKTYWRAPGPQGYPPRLDWSGSENVADARIVWPTPERFTILGFDSIGYAGGVLLPVNVTFQDPGKPARLKLAVDFLTCSDICVPQLAAFSLDLPGGSAMPSDHAFAIDRARGQAPSPAGAGDRIDRVWLEGPADQPSLALEGVAASGLDGPDVFVDGLAGYFFGAPTLERLDGGRFRLRAAAINVPEAPAATAAEATYTLRLGDGRAIEQALALGPPTGAAAPAVVAPGLLLMLGVAFLGGLILNVMPCVLPVLAIKLMGALKHAEGGRGQVRRGFLASAAGIVLSFGLLAAGAIALQGLGVAVGWGMQFQQPLFVALMAIVMAVFAANLWGLFEIHAPAAVNRAGAALPAERDGLAGSFWSGVLATALATPCSAPFVGAALSFALTEGPLEVALIFLAMGVGLAAPYLLTAAVPAVAGLLPRPGAWMNVLKRVLAVAVALTGVWLLWILWRQTGAAAAAIGGLAAVATAAALAFGGGTRTVAGAGALAAGLLGVWLTAAAPQATADDGLNWARFDEADLARRVAAGEVVLVDVTADWCVTCKWNKAAVLTQAPTVDLLQGDVTPMQADWTSPDAAITAYLAKHGRFGIPFNAVYGPGAPEGVTLPELLSADAVAEAVAKARGPQG